MRPPFVCWLALSLVVCAVPARGQDAPSAPAPAKATAGKASRATAKGTGAASTRAASGPRTLSEIHIEGEIPAPQVLFITARDQRRFMDLNHRRYLRLSREVGERTVLPTRIDVTGTRAIHP
jgi:hypothetical protein